MKTNKKNQILAIFSSLPWCCILPAILSLLGLVSGIMAVRIWALKFAPLLFILSLIFLTRAYWLLYKRRQGSMVSKILVWLTTLFVVILWIYRSKYLLKISFLLVLTLSLIFLTNLASAHEPIFSLGPETIYKGGVGIETEFEYEENSEKETAIHNEILYGVTENLSLTLGIPPFN